MKKLFQKFLLLPVLALSASPAFAQTMPGVVEGLTKVQVTLITVGVTVLTLLLMFCAFSVWRGRYENLANTLAAGVLFGFAPLIAAWIMTP